MPIKELRVEITNGDEKLSAATDGKPLTVGTAADNDLVLSDPSVSRYHLEIERREGAIIVRDLGTTNRTHVGPVWLHKGEATVDLPVDVKIGRSVLSLSEGGVKMDMAKPTTQVGRLGSMSPVMFPVLDEMKHVAPTRVPVLLLGESGSGKELFAQTIHETSGRKGKFITVDCAALTPQLFMSELFGHEKGSFTGAQAQRKGAFERADHGTIFLDELGELPPEQQTALLGVLERKRFTRVGGNTEIQVDVRVLAATNRDLRSEVNEGRFRLDLYYRLAVVLLRIPPLRQRMHDLETLVQRFMIEEGFDTKVSDAFTKDQLAAMRGHSWPGNVRELRNVVLASITTGRGPRFEEGVEGAAQTDFSGVLPPYREARQAVTEAFERQYLAALMEKEGKSVRGAARLAKMDRSYLTELLRRHGFRSTKSE